MKKYLLMLAGLSMLTLASCTKDDDHDDHDDHDHSALVIVKSNENVA
jgi:hypothetical protein